MIQANGVIRLRPSTVLKYDQCPKAVYFQEIERFRCDVTSANLAFGTAVHEATTGHILSLVSGKPFDVTEAFMEKWEAELDKTEVEFSSIWDEQSLAATGRLMVQRFPKAWAATGLMPLLDDDGPVVERRFELEIEPGLILSGEPDVVAMNKDGEIVILDFKTTAQAYDPLFVLVAEQLTAYQILLEAHREDLGIGLIEQLGFIELIKRKAPKTSHGTGPEVLEPILVGRRSERTVEEYREKLRNIAADIRAERFPRRPRMAFNTPCTMCEFAGLCLQGSMDGLHRAVDRKAQEVLMANPGLHRQLGNAQPAPLF